MIERSKLSWRNLLFWWQQGVLAPGS